MYDRQSGERRVALARPIDYAFGVAAGDKHEFYETFAAVMRSLRQASSQAYASFEVGTLQAKFLRHIGRDSKISQADLARATDTAPTLTGRALEPLIERGWVRRKRSDEDRRVYLVELTPAGQRVRHRVEKAREEIMERIGAVLDEKDVADFDRIAGKILGAFARELEKDGRG